MDGETHLPIYTQFGAAIFPFPNGARWGVSQCKQLIIEGVTADSFADSYGSVTCQACFDHKSGRFRVHEGAPDPKMQGVLAS